MNESMNESMNGLLSWYENYYENEWKTQTNRPALQAAAAIKEHLIAEYEFSESQANRFVIRCKISIWKDCDEEQTKRAIQIAKRIVDVYFHNFKSFYFEPDDFVAGADQFGIYLVPEEEEEEANG